MVVEYDPAKSAANRAKHGIDFEAAQALWSDARLLVVPARMLDEPRRVAIGRPQGRVWAAIFTTRGDVIRLISVRRARTEEVELYAGKRYPLKVSTAPSTKARTSRPISTSTRPTARGAPPAASTSISPPGWSTVWMPAPPIWASPGRR